MDEQLPARARAARLDEAEVLGREVRIQRELELAQPSARPPEADQLADGQRLPLSYDDHRGNGSGRPLRRLYLLGKGDRAYTRGNRRGDAPAAPLRSARPRSSGTEVTGTTECVDLSPRYETRLRELRLKETSMGHRDTAEVIKLFNDAFLERDAAKLVDLVADDCVMESTQPTPNGTRYEGYDACLRFWQELIADPESFGPEDVIVAGNRATIRWRYRFGDGEEGSVRGVTLMHIRDGKIVEALGYVKAGLRS